MLTYNFPRQSIEEKFNLMNSMSSEWKMITSTMKAHGQFKDYSLAQVVGLLKSHEDKVMENESQLWMHDHWF